MGTLGFEPRPAGVFIEHFLFIGVCLIAPITGAGDDSSPSGTQEIPDFRWPGFTTFP